MLPSSFIENSKLFSHFLCSGVARLVAPKCSLGCISTSRTRIKNIKRPSFSELLFCKDFHQDEIR